MKLPDFNDKIVNLTESSLLKIRMLDYVQSVSEIARIMRGQSVKLPDFNPKNVELTKYFGKKSGNARCRHDKR